MCMRTCRECIFFDRSGIVGDDPNIGDATCIHLIGVLNQCLADDPNAAAETCDYFVHLDCPTQYRVTEEPYKWNSADGPLIPVTKLLSADDFILQYPLLAHLVVLGEASEFEGLEYRADGLQTTVEAVAPDMPLT